MAEKWIYKHPEIWSKYKGLWLAINSSGLIASSLNFDEVLKIARQKSKIPFVFKIPQDSSTGKIFSPKIVK
ncbi:hypothetical protein HYS94_01620 [Candidatus Daviesbacteria bacterium]|nr:hypothetical protein [Candidatus Daviesbacteria bacterium]